jgi:regulator of replication initiation timing
MTTYDNTALTTERTVLTVGAEIKAIKRQTEVLVLNNSIEIGRRLKELKEIMSDDRFPQDAFSKYVKSELEISQSSAYNLMRIFEEYGSRQASLFGAEAESDVLGKLTYSKALALLAIPADEREEFATENDVEDISVRELKKLLAEREIELSDVKTAWNAAEIDLAKSARQIDTLTEYDEVAQNKIAGYQKKLDNVEMELAELKRRPIETIVINNADEIEEFKKKVDVAERRAKQYADDLAKEQGKAERLRQKLNEIKQTVTIPAPSASTTVERFKWVFNEWNAKLNDLLAFLPSDNAAETEKMQTAIAAALNKALEYVE